MASVAPPVNINRLPASGQSSNSSLPPGFEEDGLHDLGTDPRENVARLKRELEHEEAIRRGAENLLHQVGAGQGAKQAPANGVEGGKANLQSTVEGELDRAVARVKALQRQLAHWEPLAASPRNPRRRLVANGLLPQVPVVNEPSEADTRLALHTVEETMKTLQSLAMGQEQIEAMRTMIQLVRHHTRVRYELDRESLIACVYPCLGDAFPAEARCTAYRLLRHLLVDIRDIARLCEANVELFLIKSLSKDNRAEIEKQQALAMLRSLLSIPGGSSYMTCGIVRALVAIAETHEEKMRLMALETLTELMVIDIALLAAGQGIRTVMSSLAEGPAELAPYTAAVIMAVVDRPDSRSYLRSGFDFEVALAGLQDVSAVGHTHEQRTRGCVRLIAFLLKSWTGLMYLCTNKKRSLRVYVESLTVSSEKARSILVDGLFDIFQIKTPSWFGTFMAGKRLTYYQKPGANLPTINSDNRDITEKVSSERVTLVQHYTALLLLVFFDVGLLEALVKVAEDKGKADISRKASLLIAELLDVSRVVLPSHFGGKLQSLPHFFALASSFDNGDDRLVATSALRAVDSLHRTKQRMATAKPVADSRKRANSVDEALWNGGRHGEGARFRAGFQIDDIGFRNLVMETQVLVTKDHTKWSIERLLELTEGPMLNPKRLEEVTRSTKVMRRVLGFLHPLEGRFPYIKRTTQNARFSRLACSTLETLLSDLGGIRFLAEDKLIDQIGQCLRQLDPHANAPTSELLFSQSRVEDTLTYSYFEMLGVLSRHPDGIKLMEKAKIFTTFYSLCEMHSREDLVKAVIENIDYTLIGHSRIVLSKALTSAYKHVRLFATHHLGKLLREANGSKTWLIRLLITQLYDPSPEVCALAVEIVEEACESMEVLEVVVKMRPSLEGLGEIGGPLLLRFLSTVVGAHYLAEVDWIAREMDDWFHERNLDYVTQLEMYLAKFFDADGTRDEEDDDIIAGVPGTAPSHFYGELVKTEEGRRLLTEKGHFQEFAEFIRLHGLESKDSDIINKLKSVLWAVGNIGTSAGGLPFLEEEEIIQVIVEIAEQSEVFSVRGTCYFVLGLISLAPQAPDLLLEYGWEASLTPLGISTGVCIPQDLDVFVVISPWKILSPLENRSSYNGVVAGIRRLVLDSISNLSNQLVANNASKTLARLKQKHCSIFTEPAMLGHALRLLAHYHYRLPTRRYVIELFSDILVDAPVAATIRNLPVPRPKLSNSSDPSATSIGDSANEMRLGDQPPLRSGTALLNAFDKTDYISGSDEDENYTGRRVSSNKDVKKSMEPLMVVKGFLL